MRTTYPKHKLSTPICSTFIFVLLCPALDAAEVPFTEDFMQGAAGWRDVNNVELTWFPTGGPGDSSFATGDFNFVNSVADDTPVILRAQDEFNSSDGAFEGDWIADRITRFAIFVRHDAPMPLTYFARFAMPANFPGAVAVNFQPVPPDTWTKLSFTIDENSPQFISFETSDFATIFSNIGHVQLGVSVPAGLAGVDQAFAFDIDQAHVESKFIFDLPSDDRWYYPFNFTPGTRFEGPLFSSLPFTQFNNRDGQDIFLWDTASLIPPGDGPGSYPVRSVRVRLTHRADATFVPSWQPDLTVDEWFTYDTNADGEINADGVPRGEPGDTDGESSDADPGRPIELFGAGFGPTYTLETFDEYSPYIGSDSVDDIPRDPFPFVHRINADQSVDLVHVEDNIFGLHNEDLVPPLCEDPDGLCPFTASPWSIGEPFDYSPGAQLTPFEVVFDVDLCQSQQLVRGYFEEQLNAGRVALIATSLAVAEFGGGGDPLPRPTFYFKESTDEGALPAVLEIELGNNFDDCNMNGIPDECEELADLDSDGSVDVVDLLALLANWGLCPDQPCAGDVNCDGEIDIVDLLALLSRWGAV